MDEVLVVRDLVKYYGSLSALKGISFAVRRGEVFGLIGPNGAGKTTTLRIVATLIKPSSGTAKVEGYDVVKDASTVRRLISYLPEEAGAYPHLTGREYLRLVLSFHHPDPRDLEEAVDEAIRISGLGDRIDDKVKTYSKGMKRRLLLARTLAAEPKLAILDEPTSGLDVLHALHVRRVIREYARKRGIAVLLSSHNMLEVEFLCDRVGMLSDGVLLEVDTPAALKLKYSARNLEEVFWVVAGGRRWAASGG